MIKKIINTIVAAAFLSSCNYASLIRNATLDEKISEPYSLAENCPEYKNKRYAQKLFEENECVVYEKSNEDTVSIFRHLPEEKFRRYLSEDEYNQMKPIPNGGIYYEITENKEGFEVEKKLVLDESYGGKPWQHRYSIVKEFELYNGEFRKMALESIIIRVVLKLENEQN